MTTPNKGKISLAIAATLGFLIFSLGLAEIGLRLFMPEERLLFGSPCLVPHPKELFAFRPGCDTVEGESRPIRIRTNEDGFRDRPRNFFRERGAVLVLGDSDVEAPRLEVADGLTAALERRLAPKIGYPLLNLGLRGSGPSQHVLRARRALQHYPVKGVIWVFNWSDTIDEVFFRGTHAEAARGKKTGALGDFARAAVRRLQGLYLTYYVHTFFLVTPNYARFAKDRPRTAEPYCRPFREFSQELERLGIPLVFLAFNLTPYRDQGQYMTLAPTEADLALLLECVKSTGRPLVNAHRDFPATRDLFRENDFHFTKEGTEIFAAWAATPIAEALKIGNKQKDSSAKRASR